MTKFEKRIKDRLSTEQFLNIAINAEKTSTLLNKVHRNSVHKMMCTVQLQAWRVQLTNECSI